MQTWNAQDGEFHFHRRSGAGPAAEVVRVDGGEADHLLEISEAFLKRLHGLVVCRGVSGLYDNPNCGRTFQNLLDDFRSRRRLGETLQNRSVELAAPRWWSV